MSSVIRLALAVISIACIGGLDAIVTPRLAFAPSYAPIVAVAAWYLGRSQGTAVATAAALARFASELSWYRLDATVIWNACVWAVLLVALARLVAWGRERRSEVGALEGRVTELVQIEHSFARTDPLTSLCNRRAFVDALQQAEARSRRSGGALAVARLDIDAFGRLNQIYSRADGDQLLRAVSTSLSLTTRMGDLAARLDNDEFAILLYGCGPEDAQRVGQRLVSEVAELGRSYPEARVTTSIGVACFTSNGPDPDEMMRLAGSALRRAQEHGGDTVIVEREWAAAEERRAPS